MGSGIPVVFFRLIRIATTDVLLFQPYNATRRKHTEGFINAGNAVW